MTASGSFCSDTSSASCARSRPASQSPALMLTFDNTRSDSISARSSPISLAMRSASEACFCASSHLFVSAKTFPTPESVNEIPARSPSWRDIDSASLKDLRSSSCFPRVLYISPMLCSVVATPFQTHVFDGIPIEGATARREITCNSGIAPCPAGLTRCLTPLTIMINSWTIYETWEGCTHVGTL